MKHNYEHKFQNKEKRFADVPTDQRVEQLTFPSSQKQQAFTLFFRKKLRTLHTGRLAFLMLLLLETLQVPFQAAAQIVYDGPLEITEGGTYTGNWESLDSEIPAVNIKTTEPVIILNSNIRGAGYLINGDFPGGVNLTVKHTNGYGINPTPWYNYMKPRRFLTVSSFKHVIVENCYMENTAGMLFYNYEGNSTANNTVKVRYNKAKNIDGRVVNGGLDNAQFVQFNFNNDNPIKYAEIAWNQIINEPDNSAVEDNISIYNAKGMPDSYIHIHNNYIEGAFPNPRSATSYTGGGITVESPGDLTGDTYEYQSSYILIEHNQLVGIGNSSIGVANGWDIIIRNNRAVNACQYNDTSNRYPYWTHGIYTNNAYLTSQTEIAKLDTSDIEVYSNVLGIEQTDGGRSEYGDPHGMATYSNNSSISGDITEAMEADEFTLWLQKLSQNGIGIGPNPTSPGNRATGTITREYWGNVTTESISAIPLTTTPDSLTELTLFESPSHVADNYGQRVRGYVTAPATGQYTFWIASDNHSELWLSTSEDPANKVKIAEVNGYTSVQQWDKFTSQQSAQITLQAGQRYYIEALHVEGTAGDNLAVGWQLPNSTYERPIPGNRLSPFDPGMTATSSSAILLGDRLGQEKTNAVVHPNPFRNRITVIFPAHEPVLQQVALYNQAGQVVYHVAQPKLKENKLELDLSGSRIKPGFYILRYTDSNGASRNVKMIKQ